MKTKQFAISMELRKILAANWQTAAQLAAQIMIPPEVVGRHFEMRKKIRQCSLTISGAKVDIVVRALQNLTSKGVAEKRKAQGGKNEYRIKQ